MKFQTHYFKQKFRTSTSNQTPWLFVCNYNQPYHCLEAKIFIFIFPKLMKKNGFLLTRRASDELINLSCMSSRGRSRAQRERYLLLPSKCSRLHCSGIKAIWRQGLLSHIFLYCLETVCSTKFDKRQTKIVFSQWGNYKWSKSYYECKVWCQNFAFKTAIV